MIADLVGNIMYKGIDRFSKQDNKPITEVQLLLSSDSENTQYKKLLLGSDSKEITFNEILGIKGFDIMQREAICGSFINKTLKNFSEEMDCDIKSLFVLIYVMDEEATEVELMLYKGSQIIRKLELQQILA